jgi:phosphoglycerol geranylgeranyltransferase
MLLHGALNDKPRMRTSIYNTLFSNKKKTKVAVLIDPDKQDFKSVGKTIEICNHCEVDLIMIGGSLVSENPEVFIIKIKKHTQLPVILFPGSLMQISGKADAILLLSLISGRNPEYLIGNHVIAAQYIKKSKLEVIPTGYILIESGNTTSVQYISNTLPIPRNKPGIAVATAIAGEMLGLKAIYLEAGSGATNSVPAEIISAVKKNISIPLIVGGGIRTSTQIDNIKNAGADIIVIGNSLENNPDKLYKLLNKPKQNK